MSIQPEPQPMPMLSLLHEQSCCGKKCIRCPYIDQKGRSHSRGSIFLNTKKIYAHIIFLAKTGHLEEAKQLKQELDIRKQILHLQNA